MVRLGVVSGLLWAAGLALASPGPAPLVGVRTRNFPGTSDEYTLHEVWRRLAALAHQRRDTVFENSTSIDKSWSDAVLFSQSFTPNTSSVEGLEAELSIEVACATCYLKGAATAKLAINGEFDFGNTIKNLTEQATDEFGNLAKTAADTLWGVAGNLIKEAMDLFDDNKADGFDFDEVFSFDKYHIDTDIDVNFPPLPQVQLLFQIDRLDLYVAMDITIAAQSTLTLPLYKSQTAIGISASEDLEIGVFVTMDLILSVEGEISLRTGFHLLFDDPVGFNISLFSSNVSSIIFNGGKFEFLPVTIISGNVALKAILRVGMHAGFEISSKAALPFKPATSVGKKIRDATTFSAGVEVGVFAHLAEFLTNITGGANLKAEEGCALKIVEEYTLALGAAAGATIAVANHTWGPQPTTTMPIFYTTLVDVCAATAKTKTTSAATRPASSNSLAARQPQQTGAPSLLTTTLTTTVRHTGIGCASPNMALCPSSLQTTSILTSTKTLVTAVPSGVVPTFPPTTADSVASTIPFGKQTNNLAATSGVPVSYVPPPPPPSSTSTSSAGGGVGDLVHDIGETFGGQTGGVSNKLIIGLSVGLGVPFLAAVVAALVYWLKRRRYAAVPSKTDTAVEYTGEYTGEYQSPIAGERESMLNKSPAVAVGQVEQHRRE